MQTFFPFPDVWRSMAILDTVRLRKQRLEAWQIHRCLTEPGRKGWQYHPAVRMWRGHTGALVRYYNICLRMYAALGGNNLRLQPLLNSPESDQWPWWVGVKAFHLSHQSKLLAKDRQHYGSWFAGVPDNLPYLWPTEQVGVFEVIPNAQELRAGQVRRFIREIGENPAISS